MLTIISPSKTQGIDRESQKDHSIPQFIKQCQTLVEKLQKLSVAELGQTMAISTKLADLTHRRLADFQFPPTQQRCCQALLAFKGDVYSAIDGANYTPDELQFAQNHLGILSGLYGILRPLDLIQPYRLEMGSKFKPAEGVTLYHFWREAITSSINKALSAMEEPVLINLASNEYFRVINTKQLQGTIVHISFKQVKNGKLRTIAIHAKKARGAMVHFIIRNRLEKVRDLCLFDHDGYHFEQKLSSDTELLFSR